MTGDSTTADGSTTLTDPGTLLTRDDVPVETATHELPPADFVDTDDWDSHVVVGVADDRGALLHDDGDHGWTLPAFAPGPGDDWLSVARDGFERLTGVPVAIDAIRAARRREFREADGVQRRVVWNVLVTATPATRIPDDPKRADTPDGTDDPSRPADGAALRWFDAPPADAPDAVVTDVERTLETRDS